MIKAVIPSKAFNLHFERHRMLREVLTCRHCSSPPGSQAEQIGAPLLRPTRPAVRTSVTQIGPYDKQSDPTDEESGGQILCVCVCVWGKSLLYAIIK